MPQTETEQAAATVSPEEIERRIAEYRRLGFEHQAAAHVVYQGLNQRCPWPDCDLRIAGIGFQLEKMGDSALLNELLAAWWQGPGLVGRCPSCRRDVLFSLGNKQAVTDPVRLGYTVLPKDWHQKAYVVVRSTPVAGDRDADTPVDNLHP
jgi:hypothetical protein